MNLSWQTLLRPLAGNFSRHIVSFGVEPCSFINTAEGEPLSWIESGPGGLERHGHATFLPECNCLQIATRLTNTASGPEPFDATVLRLKLALLDQPYRSFRVSGGLDDGHYPPENYRTQEVLISSSLVNCSPPGGRSSDRNLPITLVADAAGNGLWFGLE